MITGEIDPGPGHQGDQLGNEVRSFEFATIGIQLPVVGPDLDQSRYTSDLY